ncbi:MAG: hypothetical protein ACLS3V_10220 [Streptococcus sp.]
MGKLDDFLAEANQDDFTPQMPFHFNLVPFAKAYRYPKHDQIDRSVDVKRFAVKQNYETAFLALENVDDYLNGDLFENESMLSLIL